MWQARKVLLRPAESLPEGGGRMGTGCRRKFAARSDVVEIARTGLFGDPVWRSEGAKKAETPTTG